VKKDFISQLKTRLGSYKGRGTNHEGQPFTGSLTISKLLGGIGICLSFKAIGDDGTSLHEEVSTIAPDLSGRIGLYNLNTNLPGILHHILCENTATLAGLESAVFRFGERSNVSSFREEITMELLPTGQIGYKYAWGMPGGDFADRSGALMERLQSVE
jgi:hypothetical protein